MFMDFRGSASQSVHDILSVHDGRTEAKGDWKVDWMELG